MNNRAEIEKLLIDCGHAINVNNGKCELIEDVLCRTTTLCCEILDQLAAQEQAYSEEMHRQNPTPDRWGKLGF